MPQQAQGQTLEVQASEVKTNNETAKASPPGDTPEDAPDIPAQAPEVESEPIALTVPVDETGNAEQSPRNLEKNEATPTPSPSEVPASPEPIAWATTIRNTSIYEKPSYGGPKTPLGVDNPVIVHEKDKYGWFRIETAGKTAGWIPGFHARMESGPPPAVLLPPPPEPEPEPDPQPTVVIPPPEPPPDIPPMSPEQIASRLNVVKLEIEAMRDFIRLQPSSVLKVSVLFTLDLTDQDAASRRIADLSARIAEKKRVVRFLAAQAEKTEPAQIETSNPSAAPATEAAQETTTAEQKSPPASEAPAPAGQASESDPATRLALEKAELELLELRQAFLSHSPDERKALLAAEVEADRLALLKAKEEADRLRAEKESRAAEEARRLALERARAATSAAERALALERAKLEGVKGELAEFRKRIALSRQDMITLGEQRAKELAETVALVGAVRRQSLEADNLYDSIVDQLNVARAKISEDFQSASSLQKAPRFPDTPADLQALTPEQIKEKSNLAAGVIRISTEADEADKEMRQVAWERARSTVDHELALNQLRLKLLDFITLSKRDRILGFGPEGIAQFGRELVHFSLVISWMEFAGERLAYEKLQKLKDPYQFIATVAPLLALVMLFVFYWLLRNALGKYFERPFVRSVGMGSRSLSERLGRLAYGIGKPLHKEILFLAFVMLLPVFADVHAEQSGITLIYRLLLIYGFYRLIQVASFRLLLDVIRDSVGQLDAERREKLLRSVVIATRFSFWMLGLLVVAAYILGKGYLYHLAVWVTQIGAFIIAIGMIVWWRKKITDDIIALRPNAMIVKELQRASGRWYNLLLVFVGFAYLIWIGLVGALRRLMLGFDFSQKLLAYLFRKKLEQQKEKTRDTSQKALPAEILDCFKEFFNNNSAVLVDYFPKIDAFLEQFAAWKEGNRTGSFLVLGKTGHGKTTWLNEAINRIGDFPRVSLCLTKRMVTPESVLAFFSQELLAENDRPASIEELAERLRKNERKLVVIDDMQYMFLRGVDTIRGWWAFNRLMEETTGHIFWLGSFSQHAYQFLSWVRNDNDAFRDSVTLVPWDEKRIGAMLTKRMQKTGWTARYASLLPDRSGTVYTDAQIAEITADFNRLIWDFALGAPRSAIYHWKKSLIPSDGKTMDIRMFPKPDIVALEERDETDKFTLAAVFWHQHINAEDAAQSLGYPLYASRDSLEKMRELGILENRRGDYAVSVEWWPLVYRYLRRKNLIRT
jgi:hypothetical protein